LNTGKQLLVRELPNKSGDVPKSPFLHSGSPGARQQAQ
jgi:hypothetical protein